MCQTRAGTVPGTGTFPTAPQESRRLRPRRYLRLNTVRFKTVLTSLADDETYLRLSAALAYEPPHRTDTDRHTPHLTTHNGSRGARLEPRCDHDDRINQPSNALVPCPTQGTHAMSRLSCVHEGARAHTHMPTSPARPHVMSHGHHTLQRPEGARTASRRTAPSTRRALSLP